MEPTIACERWSMAYKPEQLPFKEFGETVRGLKQRIDKMAPHYPLAAEARDRNGQVLMQKVFTGPFAKPAEQIVHDTGEWDVPVTVEMKDDSGVSFSEELDKVTVGRTLENDGQLDLREWLD